MIEAVGHENLPAYFHAIGRVLKPGGKAAIQVCPHLARQCSDTTQVASTAHGDTMDTCARRKLQGAQPVHSTQQYLKAASDISVGLSNKTQLAAKHAASS